MAENPYKYGGYYWSQRLKPFLEEPDISSDQLVDAYIGDQVDTFNRLRNGTCTRQIETGDHCLNGCGTKEEIFTGFEQLWHCTMLPQVAGNYRLDKLTKEQSGHVEMFGFDTGLELSRDVTQTIASCLMAYCQGTDGCRELNPSSCSLAELASRNMSTLNVPSIHLCITKICENDPYPRANPDIAGAGLVASYIIQNSITLLGALILAGIRLFYRIRKWRIKYVPDEIPQTEEAAQASESQQESEHAELQQNGTARMERFHSMLQSTYEATLATLIDFQRAQSFLAIAISVAGIIATYTLSTDETSILDEASLLLVGGIGILPVAFNLYLLASFNPSRKSWYLFGLSFTSWILASLVVGKPRNNLDVSQASKIDSRFPSACASASPETLCASVNVGMRPETAPVFVTYFYTACIPAMLGLFVWQLHSIHWVETVTSAKAFDTFREHSTRWKGVMHACAVGGFAAVFVVFFTGIGDSYRTASSTWGFGQVVAVTVWLPTLAGAVNYWVDGVGAASTKMLPETHWTMRVKESNAQKE